MQTMFAGPDHPLEVECGISTLIALEFAILAPDLVRKIWIACLGCQILEFVFHIFHFAPKTVALLRVLTDAIGYFLINAVEWNGV